MAERKASKKKYLWLDLLCIPQYDDFTRDARLASLFNSKICRQAGRFRYVMVFAIRLSSGAVISEKLTIIGMLLFA